MVCIMKSSFQLVWVLVLSVVVVGCGGNGASSGAGVQSGIDASLGSIPLKEEFTNSYMIQHGVSKAEAEKAYEALLEKIKAQEDIEKTNKLITEKKQLSDKIQIGTQSGLSQKDAELLALSMAEWELPKYGILYGVSALEDPRYWTFRNFLSPGQGTFSDYYQLTTTDENGYAIIKSPSTFFKDIQSVLNLDSYVEFGKKDGDPYFSKWGNQFDVLFAGIEARYKNNSSALKIVEDKKEILSQSLSNIINADDQWGSLIQMVTIVGGSTDLKVSSDLQVQGGMLKADALNEEINKEYSATITNLGDILNGSEVLNYNPIIDGSLEKFSSLIVNRLRDYSKDVIPFNAEIESAQRTLDSIKSYQFSGDESLLVQYEVAQGQLDEAKASLAQFNSGYVQVTESLAKELVRYIRENSPAYAYIFPIDFEEKDNSSKALSIGADLSSGNMVSHRQARLLGGEINTSQFSFNGRQGDVISLRGPLSLQIKGSLDSQKNTDGLVTSLTFKAGPTLVGAEAEYVNKDSHFSSGKRLNVSALVAHSFGPFFAEAKLGRVDAENYLGVSCSGTVYSAKVGFDGSFVTPFFEVNHCLLTSGYDKFSVTQSFVGLDIGTLELSGQQFESKISLVAKASKDRFLISFASNHKLFEGFDLNSSLDLDSRDSTKLSIDVAFRR
jgi:hypothetical protein